MKRKLTVLLILGISLTLGANPLAKMYRVNDPILAQIEELSLESGINPFVPSGIVSGYTLYQHLEKIDSRKLSTESNEALQSIKEEILNPFDDKVFDYSISATLEGYVNTDKDAKFYDWAEGYAKRSSIVSLAAETIFGDMGYGIFTYDLQKGFNPSRFTGFSTNLPPFEGDVSTKLQNSIPFTAFLGYSNDWLTLTFGRDALRLGRGNSGNLTVHDNGPYNDFVSVSMANKSMRYTFTAIPMNELDEGGKVHPNEQRNFFDTYRRTYISHRLSMDFFPWWRLTAAEGVMFYSKSLDIRIFSPLMFLHNLQNFKEVNNSFSLESEITLSPHWALNLQVFLDQFQTAGEQGASANTLPPNAYAFLLGGRFSYPLNDWKLSGYVEGVYTSPFVYIRNGDNTGMITESEGGSNQQYNLDFVNAIRMAYEGISGVSWLGYPDGPDSIIFNTRLDAHYQDWLSLFGSIKAKISGERGLKIWGKEQNVELQYPKDINMPSPSGGDPTYELALGLGGSVRLFDTNITLVLRNYVVNRWKGSSYRVDNQLTFGISYTF